MEDDGYREDGRPSYWAELAPGYNFEDCTSIHEGTIKELYQALARVREGYPADSVEHRSRQ